jgi:translocation and assembly module TamA
MLLVVVPVAKPGLAADRPEKKALVQGIDNRTLREEIERAIGESLEPAQSRIEARRRARDAQDSAELMLRSEGFYDYAVETDITEGDRPQGIVRITLGPRTHFGPINIKWLKAPPDEDSIKAAFDAIDIRTGASARAEDVVEAQARIVSILEVRGYADARAEAPDVVVDHADTSMSPTFNVESAQLVRMGGLVFSNPKQRTDPAFIRKLAPWKAGEVYHPNAIADLEHRLLDTGVYDSVTVSLAPRTEAVPGAPLLPTGEALRPVMVNLSERSKHALDFTAGYSTSEGTDFDVRWSDFNRFRRADTLVYGARLATIDSRAGVQWSTPHFLVPGETLKLAGDWFRTVAPAYTEQGAVISADLTRRFRTTSYVTEGASVTSSQVIDKETGKIRIITVRLVGALALDHSDNPLDPRQGWKLEAHVTPTDIQGDEQQVYLKSQLQVTGYLPLDRQREWVVAGRLHVGSIIGGTIPGVPAPDRFFAGGGGSVRGYSYQDIGPHYADNTPIGGLSLTETSVELRRRFGTSPWGAVLFFDAGSVAETVNPDFHHVDTAVGVGFRYHLNFAPIRADLAFPLQKASNSGQQPFQVYLSIGQSF